MEERRALGDEYQEVAAGHRVHATHRRQQQAKALETGVVRAAFPGSFDPLTVAHLGIAETARDHFDLECVELVISRVALGKENLGRVRLHERVAAIEAARANRPWLGLDVTDLQLLSDIAEPYDLVIVGADKWAQLHDPAFYPSTEALAAALAKLPRVAVVPRPPHPVPKDLRLDVPGYESVSSTAVREHGRTDWLAPEATWG
jgi:nicotinic acid mononucleotide adenylyltransferase